MANKEVKTLTVDDVTYDIKDEKARTAAAQAQADVATKQDILPSGTTGQVLTATESGIAFQDIPWDDKFKLVNALPENPDANTFYFIPE